MPPQKKLTYFSALQNFYNIDVLLAFHFANTFCMNHTYDVDPEPLTADQFNHSQPVIIKLWTKEKLSFLFLFCLLSVSGVAQYSPLVDHDHTVFPFIEKPQSTFTGAVFHHSAYQQDVSQRPASPFLRTIAAPTILISGGLLTFNDNPIFDKYDVWEARQEHLPGFRTHIDDYLIFAPIAAVYGLDAVGVQAKHTFLRQTLLIAFSSLLSQAVIIPVKNISHVERPDHSNFKSFPSGHTTQAFVAATFMHKEFGDLSPWYSIGAYTTATAIGALRMMNNKHWLSDVLVGAGVGILSTNVAYLIFPGKTAKNEKSSDLMIMPTYNDGAMGFNMMVKLR